VRAGLAAAGLVQHDCVHSPHRDRGQWWADIDRDALVVRQQREWIEEKDAGRKLTCWDLCHDGDPMDGLTADGYAHQRQLT
jgi:hypothetical protein